ncbi:MAG TPA: amino acid permease [Candidatus Nanopelagicaceae bacterium]
MPKSWTDNAPEPMALHDHAHLRDPISYKLKKALLGNPLNRHLLSHQRLSKVYALGILSSDCISSSAYGTENILYYLLPAFGLASFGILMPMTFVVLAVLLIVTLSYREVVMVYTKTGGSYVVARDNFGPAVAQVAAVALMLDYIVTVAVQTSAGTSAMTSAFPALASYNLIITLGVIAILFFGNLKGVKEAGRAFAAPTYLFVGAMVPVFILGLWKEFHGGIHHVVVHSGNVGLGHSQSLITALSVFVLLKAFANGGSSLTGLEAISNGVSLFKAPEGRNARRTTVIMASILGTLVLGVSWFAKETQAFPYKGGTPTVISQIADVILGRSAIGHALYLVVQFSTMLILYTGANTPYSGFPFLANFIAEDGFLPRQLTKRGHRLVFSNGIIFLTVSASALLIVVGANVAKLVAFYAIGVFTGFAMAGFGMAKRFWTRKEENWKLHFCINLLSGTVSSVVVLIFAVVKFTDGAWLIVFIFPVATAGLLRFNKQYRREQIALRIKDTQSRGTSISRHDVTILVDTVDLATVGAVRYARSLNPHSLSAVHFVIDDQHAEDIRKAWVSTPGLDDVTLQLIDCPDRRLPNAAVDYAIKVTAAEDVELTLLLPRRSYAPVLGKLLHDQTAEEIARPISQLPRVVATIVPFDVVKMLAGNDVVVHEQHEPTPAPAPKIVSASVVSFKNSEPVSHYAENITPIGKITWRNRAQVQGRVTSIKTAPRGSAPTLDVEVWDETGGVTLQFLGRREIAGLDVGSQLRAEGMVGEDSGSLTILNPSYEIVI